MNSTIKKNGDTPRNLRVIYVIPGEDHGINMSFSRRQATAVGSLGVNVQSFFLRSRTSPIKIWKELLRLRREIQQFNPDVVHAHFGTMTAFVSALASKKPLVITFHGSDLNPAPGMSQLRSKLGHILSRFAAKRAAQIICVSAQLHERLPRLKNRLNVVPCGVDMGQFCLRPKKECREKLGWDLNEKIVLFNARTDPVGKRLDLAEAAAEHAQSFVSNLRLHVFRGMTPPDEMPLYYSAADALLMTSDYEGSPMVVKEALACNLPIISVDVGDVTERLAGVSQSAVVARDPKILGNKLIDILRKNCPSNGRKMASDIGEESIAKKVVLIYQLAAGWKKNSMLDVSLDQTPGPSVGTCKQAM